MEEEEVEAEVAEVEDEEEEETLKDLVKRAQHQALELERRENPYPIIFTILDQLNKQVISPSLQLI